MLPSDKGAAIPCSSSLGDGFPRTLDVLDATTSKEQGKCDNDHMSGSNNNVPESQQSRVKSFSPSTFRSKIKKTLCRSL